MGANRRTAARSLALAAERYGAATMLGIAAALAFQFPLSSAVDPADLHIGPHVAAENAAMARVPDGATVATDLDLLAPLAARTDTFWLGNFGTNPPTQYIVFDNQNTDWQPPRSNVLSFVESLTHNTRVRADLRERRRLRLPPGRIAVSARHVGH